MPPRPPRFATLSIFFPAWNEEDSIERAVDAAREAADRLIDRGEIGTYEILVIDDASTDGTAAAASSATGFNGTTAPRRRKPSAVKSAFAPASASRVATAPAP